MLDDDEWAVLMEAHRACRSPTRHGRCDGGAGARGCASGPSAAASPGAGREADEMFTGVEETVPNAVWHHVASLYGPPCRDCAKPLRTPQAKLCAACGWGMSE
ncbi:MAG TPA: hypothetical protein VFS20_02405 [Longimicrobium sp.]|nr:hypothetical protein [Longimicrobium sp.]